MVAQDREGGSALHQLLHKKNNSGTVRTAITKVTDENKFSISRMKAIGLVAKMRQQRSKGVEFSVNVTNDIKRTIGKSLDEFHGF